MMKEESMLEYLENILKICFDTSTRMPFVENVCIKTECRV